MMVLMLMLMMMMTTTTTMMMVMIMMIMNTTIFGLLDRPKIEDVLFQRSRIFCPRPFIISLFPVLAYPIGRIAKHFLIKVGQHVQQYADDTPLPVALSRPPSRRISRRPPAGKKCGLAAG